MQFHFAPLPLAEVESILNSKGMLKPADIKLAAQLSEGSPGLATEIECGSGGGAATSGSTDFGTCGAGTGVLAALRSQQSAREGSGNRRMKMYSAISMDCFRLLELTAG